jgi:hypothetical protein
MPGRDGSRLFFSDWPVELRDLQGPGVRLCTAGDVAPGVAENASREDDERLLRRTKVDIPARLVEDFGEGLRD